MMEEKKRTVRRQKIKKDHTKLKMILFGLLVLAVILMSRIWEMRCCRRAGRTFWGRTAMEETCCPA